MSGINEGRKEVPFLLQFSGKQEDWRMWSRKFIARASMMNYVDVLLGIEETPELLPLNVVESAEEIKFTLWKQQEDMAGKQLEIGQYVKAVPLQKQNKRMFPSHHRIHLPNQVNAYSWILAQCRQGVMEDPNSGAWLWMSFQK